MKQFRNAFCKLVRAACERFGREDLTIAEIGVKKAEGSAEYLREFPKAKVILIDPWERIPDTHPSVARWKDTPLTQEKWDEFYLESVENLMPFRGQWVLCRMKSAEAAPFFADGSIHAAFIDGDHFDCGTDIKLWWPKVAPGGVLAGDDFSHPRSSTNPKWNRWDIKFAVQAFEKQTGLSLFVDGRVWSFRKPG